MLDSLTAEGLIKPQMLVKDDTGQHHYIPVASVSMREWTTEPS